MPKKGEAQVSCQMRGTIFRRWAIFAITTILFLISQFYRASNAVISPHLCQDLVLDTEGLGLISAAFFYAFALTQIPLGILLDRVGPRQTMTVLSILGVAGALIFAWADSLSVGILGRIFMGIGMSCNLMGTFKILTIWFRPVSFATMSGITFSIGTLGNMAATTPLVILVQGMGWRLAFSLIAGINLLLAMILYGVVRDRPEEKAYFVLPPESSFRFHDILSNLRILFQKRDYWIISCGSFFRYGVFAAVQTLWAGPYLMGVMGLSALEAGNVIFLINVGLIIGGPIWGMLSDRILKRRKRVVLFGLLIFSLIMFIIAMLSPGTRLSVLAFFFFCFGFSGGAGQVMFAHIKELMPIEMAGVAMTGINFFTMMGAAIFVHGLGSLMQHLYPHASQGIDAFRGAFLVCAACLAGVSLLYIFTSDISPVESA